MSEPAKTSHIDIGSANDPKPLSFSDALELLKGGNRLMRAGWNGKGFWVELMGTAGCNYADCPNEMTLPFLFIEYPEGHPAYPSGARVPWLASQTDILAEDWFLFSEPA